MVKTTERETSVSWSISFYPSDHRRIDRIRTAVYQVTGALHSKSAIIRLALEVLETQYNNIGEEPKAGLVDVQYAKEETAL